MILQVSAIGGLATLRTARTVRLRCTISPASDVTHVLFPFFVLSLWVGSGMSVQAQVNLTGSLTLVQEGPVAAAAGDPAPPNLATGATPFALDELDFGTHFIANLNDGIYGNASSWIGGGDLGTEGAFVGIDLGALPTPNVQSIAFSRSNVMSGDPCAGACTDRWDGLYTLQYTQVPDPSLDLTLASTGDASSGWVDIGTIEYVGSAGQGSLFRDPWVRHRYNFDPVNATGVRLIVPGSGLAGGTAIDEIELFDTAGSVQPPLDQPPSLEIMAAEGFAVTWDGNDGRFFDTTPPPTGARVPPNAALASQGAVPFASSELQIGPHFAPSINDGFYGNANSWIGGPGDENPFIGVSFGREIDVRTVAWGRDNGNGGLGEAGTDACGGQCIDRWEGLYTLQYTLTTDPGVLTPDTGDASTGWQTIATFDYIGSLDDVPGGEFTGYLRHEYAVATADGAAIAATGLRLLVPNNGIAIDEFEVNTIPEPSTLVLSVLLVLGACASRATR